MKEQIINIEITRDGQVNADASGFTGDICLKDLERLLEGLSPGMSDIKRKIDDGKARVSRSNVQNIGSQR